MEIIFLIRNVQAAGVPSLLFCVIRSLRAE
jgi:hypothetical protein